MNSNLSLTNCLENLRAKYDIVAEIDCNDMSAAALANKIYAAHQDAFLPQQRILIYYTSGDPNTQQNIQTILNAVDISNFFVYIITTQTLQSVTSTDAIPFNFIQVDGEFSVTRNDAMITKEGITRLTSSLAVVDNELLTNSKHFCLAPWIHLFVSTQGDAKLCCNQENKLGSVKDQTINEIFHSVEMQDIRNMMQEDLPVSGCNRCYLEESHRRSSPRIAFNQKYAHHFERVTNNTPSILHWDFRFSNLCNLSCRSCGPYASTSWYKPAQAIGIQQSQYVCNDNTVYKQLLEYIDDVEEIYFAGGEPLIMPEHYELLDRLIDLGKTNVRLVYNTNLTEVKFKGRLIFDLWNQFDSVAVCASLDASHERAEYLRCGSNWSQIVENRKHMMQECPDIYFWVSATTGIINALHVPDFHREWVDQGLIKPENFNIQNIYAPEYMRVDRATTELKEMIIERYNEHLRWLKPVDIEGRASQGYESVINYLRDLKGFDKDLFWSNIKPLDEYYGVNLLDVFPELDILPKP